MIITEFYRTRNDGVDLVRTYSDKGYMIERDGILYEEAIDPVGFDRTYTEAETPTETEATEADLKAQTYDILMGVE